MRVKKELNLLNRVLSAASGVSATQEEYTTPTIGVGFLGAVEQYFEVVTHSTASIAYDVSVIMAGGGTAATINVPLGTTAYTRLRVALPSPLAQDNYRVVISAAAGATKNVKSARFTWVDDGAVRSFTYIDIGVRDAGKINTTDAPLSVPKLWLYTAANYDGTTKTFTALVWYLTATTKNTCTAILQQDDGSFGSWTNVATIFSGGSSLAATYGSVAFTPVDGRHYRIVTSGSTSKSAYNILSAMIMIEQNSTTLLDSDSDTIASLLTAHFKLEDGVDEKGGTSLSATGSTAFNAGLFNNAANFGSTEAHANKLSAATVFGLTNAVRQNWSVSMWLKITTIPVAATNTFFHLQDSAGKTITLRISSGSGGLWSVVAGGSAPGASGAVTAGVWYHVCFTMGSNGTWIMYANGVNVQAGTAPDAGGSPGPVVGFGNLGSGFSNSGLACLLDNAQVYIGIKFTGFQVQQLYYKQIKKFEIPFTIGNTTLVGTGLQDHDTYYDPADWVGSNVEFYHEVNSAAAGTSDLKLQDISGPTDIAGSAITDAIERERSSVLTMPGAAATIDVNVTSNANNIWSSKLIAVVTEPLPPATPSYIGGTEMMHLGVGQL